jgi:hypothetical protein
MKKNIYITAFLMLLFPAAYPVYGQYIESVEEIIAGNNFGYGARQMAMGGAGMMSIDGAALFYNPANLARIPRIEFNFGLSNQKYKDISTVRPIRKIVDYSGVFPTVSTFPGRFAGFSASSSIAENSKTNTRINSALISIPYPTYRGSMVIGLGVVRAVDFDKTFNMLHRDVSLDGAITATGDEFQSGGLYEIGFGAGVDLSPKISFGGTLLLYAGKHNYNWEYRLDSLDVYSYGIQQFIEDKYIGIGAKIGLAVQISPYVGLGMAVESPVTLNVEENSSDSWVTLDTSGEDANYVEYDVTRPFIFSAGLISQYRDFTLMTDIDYIDWNQLSYGDNPEMEKYNDEIKDYYKDALRFRIGGEYVFPGPGLSLRAGFFTDPLPYKSEFQNNSRYGYSFGAGILIDQVMTIDFAFLHGSYSRNSDFLYSSVYDGDSNKSHYLTIDEDITYNRLYLTAAYRF